MGLLVLAAVAALVLSLLTGATVALVQLVRLFTVRYTLAAMATWSFFWFIESRRRRVARGFYSCTQVPSAADHEPASQSVSKGSSHSNASRPNLKSEAQAQMTLREDEEHGNDRTGSTTADDLSGAASPTTGGSGDSGAADVERTDCLSLSSYASEVESSCEEVPVAVASAPDTVSTPERPTNTRLPDLRQRKWTHPTRSSPLFPKSESRSGRSSASSSPRRPELYDSPRSVAMEQKLMKSALESDGYWIGDFRVPPPAPPRRSRSMGASTSTSSATTSSPHRRAGSHAV